MCVLLLALAACTNRAEPRDLVGLWVQPDGGEILRAQLELEVLFVEQPDGAGCWSARAEAGGAALPVRWPTGTLVGMGAVLDVPGGFFVEVGDVVEGSGGYGDAAPDDDPPPAGCDDAGGYVELDTVREVRGPDEG